MVIGEPAYALDENGIPYLDAPPKAYAYPPESYLETVPADIIRRMMAHFDDYDFTAMCLRKPTPFRDHTAGRFSCLNIITWSHHLDFDLFTGTIYLGELVSTQTGVDVLKKHSNFITKIVFSDA